jgi:hypothetical protein
MTMSDDWRLQVSLFDDNAARALTERLDAHRLGEDLEGAFHDRLAVSVDGNEVFVYADRREQAESAAEVIRSVASEHGWAIQLELRRWHPTAEEWEEPDKPLPQSDADRLAEHEQRIANQREETTIRGYSEFEVRVQCHSHRDTVKLAERLQQEGLPVVRRWKFLLVGAPDEDAANALAERVRGEAPGGATVMAEVSRRVALDDDPRRNRFAIFGGLGG